MRKIIIALFILIVLLVGTVLIAPGLVPSSVYKDRIEGQLSKELGRNVAINGDIEVASFPFIRAKTSNVSVDNYDGFENDKFININELEAKVRLLPLFSKRVEIAGFNLDGAEIYLERRENGQVNWIDPNATVDNAAAPEKGDLPFQRDGRFTSFDPQITAFTVSNSRFVFDDKLNNEIYNISDIEGTLSLPSLNSELKTDLSLLYQGEPVILKLTLDTPENFLNGNESPFNLSLETDFATLNANGQFSETQDLDLVASLTANVSDIKKLVSFSPETIPYAELLASTDFKGDVSLRNGVLTISDSEIDVIGDTITAQYKGDATLSETPVLSGELSADVANPKALASALTPYLEKPLPQAALLGATKLSANFTSDGTNTTANAVTVTTEGTNISGRFVGKGNLTSETLSIFGNFDASLTDIQKIASTLEDPTFAPYANLLGTMTAEGQLALKNETLEISGLKADTTGGDINGSFIGDLSYDDAPNVRGQFELKIPDFTQVNQKLDLASPYAASVKTIAAKGKIETLNDVFSLKDLSATLSEGLINGDFSGAASYATNQTNGLDLNGTLTGSITDVRQLASLNGTDLPIDTDQGEIFETASLSGIVKGTTQALSLSDMKINFDDFQGSGNIDIAMATERPSINATLNLNALDLRPYMASYSAQNPTGEIQPWNETPFNVEAFNAIDGNIFITTPNIITDRLSLGQSNIKASLNKGVLKADMPNLALYGGGGQGDLVFDTSKATPELTFNVSLGELNGEGFLGAVAGFTKIIGNGGTNLSVKASGQSQAALMRSLNGQGKFGLTGGQIKGIDVVEFTTGLDEAFKTRSLPQGLGANEITSFNALDGLFSINNGIVSINEFDVSASGVSATGLGTIDLGNQIIDFKLRPRLSGETIQGIGAFGIPLQFSGGFGSASASLDTDFLGQIIAAKAKARLADEVRGQVKGPVGNILGSVLGGQTTSDTTPSSQNDNNAPVVTTPSSEDVVNDVIGGLFGGSNQTQDTQEKETTNSSDETEEPVKEEKSDIEKALGSLFGD